MLFEHFLRQMERNEYASQGGDKAPFLPVSKSLVTRPEGGGGDCDQKSLSGGRELNQQEKQLPRDPGNNQRGILGLKK